MLGISKAYGGVLSALSIRYTLTPILSSFQRSDNQLDIAQQHTWQDDSVPSTNVTNLITEKPRMGKGAGKWAEKEEIVALYPGRRSQLVLEEREVGGDFWQ